MRIIFDENIPWPMAEWLSGIDLTTVQKEGWAGIENGDLIKKSMTLSISLLLQTRNLHYQQNLRNRKVAILELPTNRWPKLLALKEVILREISEIKPSDYKIVAP